MSRVPQVEGSAEQHQPLLGQSRKHTLFRTVCVVLRWQLLLLGWRPGNQGACWDGREGGPIL